MNRVHQSNSNQDGVSNSQGAFTPEESVLPNISYHRILPDGEYFPTMLSPGYRFHPEDDELIVDYLNKEINKDRPKYIRCIRYVNVYHHSPEDLTRMYPSLGKDEWYFFTSRERKYFNGKRPNRAARNGYWKATVADKKILDRNGVHVGSKKTFVFFVGKSPRGDKTDWIMHEYVSVQPVRQRTSAHDMRLDDCVLCKIHNHKHLSKTEKETSASESSSENWNQAAPKRLKTQHMGTNQQQLSLIEVTQNFNAPQPQQNDQIHRSLNGWSYNPDGQLHNPGGQPIMEQNLLAMQYEIWPNLPALEQNHGHMSTNQTTQPQQNQQLAIHDHSLNGWSYNLDGQLHNPGGQLLDHNPDEAQPIMEQNLLALQYEILPNLPTLEQNHGDMGTNQTTQPQQNQQQTIHDHSLQGQLHFGPEANINPGEHNPDEAQPIFLERDDSLEQNLLAMQYSLPYIDFDELFDCLETNPEEIMNMQQQGIIPEEANNSNETFDDLIPNNMFGNLSQCQYGFGIN